MTESREFFYEGFNTLILSLLPRWLSDNSSASAGDAGDSGSILGQEHPLE